MTASQAEALVHNFGTVDAGDLDAALATMTDDVTFRFGSGDIARGKHGFIASSVTLATAVASMSHDLSTVLRSVDKLEPAVIAEMTVTYVRHDGSSVMLPCVNTFRFPDGLIADYRIYADIGPVFGPA
ncbi:nuclear transport factor 2 family protein [Mycobacterium camsae]|uniref:nuclear transport factor 2 family protein n=1 Tax=Mycobacterium gordonae TaxID=1778 RepID=UPI0019804DF3|nr:nuclear transport factor 2 family protein [Mycobacterium gordonae]